MKSLLLFRYSIIAVVWICFFAIPTAFAVNCDKNPGHKTCPPGGGGGDGDSGVDTHLTCTLAEESGDNLLGDGYPDYESTYEDGVHDVSCQTGGTSQPNLSGVRLSTFTGGNRKNYTRQLEIALDTCDETDCYGTFDTNTPALPSMLFSDYTGPDPFEHVQVDIRPYRVWDQPELWCEPDGCKQMDPDGFNHGGDHIQLLDTNPGIYRMAVRIGVQDLGYRLIINLAGHHVQGDKFQGILCAGEAGPEDGFSTSDALTEDAWVIVGAGPDDRYEVTTSSPLDGSDDGIMKAAICSSMLDDNGDACGKGARASDLCRFHGFVNLKFTMVADELQ